MEEPTLNILGLMSGTSLDGVDLALCRFSPSSHAVLAATTIPYPDHWRTLLASLENQSALQYALANVNLGHYFGQLANGFLRRQNLRADAIASHGHTIFHQPALGLTTQIGDGDAIAAETGLPVVSNFRTLDVALGGQGAPLVPIGDQLLFADYDACLNLGGIANISYNAGGKRIAFDICPCNMPLNWLAARLGLDYDPDGENARRGTVDSTLARRLDALDYYAARPPKSLGKEWFLNHFLPLLDASASSTIDLLATVSDHIARQIAAVVAPQPIATLLVTGGGAHNRHLIDTLRTLLPQVQITVPDPLTVNYKEAIIFALLGYLRLTAQVNTLASVTGASSDSISGTLSSLLPARG